MTPPTSPRPSAPSDSDKSADEEAEEARLSATHPDQPRDFIHAVADRDLAGERLTVDPSGERALLDARLIAAHAAGDTERLISLYDEAAASSEACGEIDAASFYRTHAYVFALQAGDPRAEALHAWLKRQGRED